MATSVAAVPASSRPASVLSFSESEFAAKYSREPFLVQHRLATHPLLQIERILELAQKLPDSHIEYNAGELPISIDHALTPQNGLSVAETLRRIAECKSWMALKYVEQDPEYAELLHECLAEIRPFSESITPGMFHAKAFIFVTSPRSVTPLHVDPEHNFLLQVSGSKTIHMYDGRNRSLLTEQQLEHFYCDRGRNMDYKPEYEQHSWTHELTPGVGLHFPVTYPHWVQNGDEVSISFSITFRTPDLDRRRAVYRMNDSLRRSLWNPAPVGTRPVRDSLMFQAYRVGRKLGIVK